MRPETCNTSMADFDYSDVLTSSFPKIDIEIVTYVNGVLEDGQDDFDSCDDLFEVIGGMLLQTDESKSEEEIVTICEKLYRLMKGYF